MSGPGGDMAEKKVDSDSSMLSDAREIESQLFEEPTTRRELWAWWIYNFAFEPISIVSPYHVSVQLFTVS